MSNVQPIPAHVLQVFQEVAPAHRKVLLDLREVIFDVASNDPRIGPVEETLRWGEPAYITTKRRTGSTIRLHMDRQSELPALFFNCKTTLVEEFRQQFGAALTYSKNRAILLDRDVQTLGPLLKTCIALALSYHLRD